ncbi:putative Fe-containing alcohol dehydrogenase [Xylariaceae sp. FL0016]|nr:putative Fe-containing alcohol dehydrogenase [Xylariaceae sp. FL0016]
MPETFGPAFPARSRPLLTYGLPFTDALLQHAEGTFHASRIYIICSGSLANNTAYLDDLKAHLGSKLVGTRVGIRPHSHWSEILEVVEDIQKSDGDLIVTLGAGSLTDAAKVISLALANNATTVQTLSSLTTSPNINPSVVPIICIPTSLSGGEYSAFAGATNDSTGQKHSFSQASSPSLIILDAHLSTTTPSRIWLSTGVKAIDHCVETLCSVASDAEADDDARRGLAKLVPGLLRSQRDPMDLDARLQCMLGVRDAMSACSRGVPLGASHGIGHQLGPAGVGHGETSCILNPAVCKYNYEKGANVARQDAVSALLWQDSDAAKIFEARGLQRETADLGDLMDAVVRALKMPRTLKEFGIGEEKLDGIAEHSLKDRWVKTNPAPLDKEGILEILRMVLG